MLKTNSVALTKPSQPSSASAGVVVKPSRVSATSVKVTPLASAVPAPTQSANSASVTAGPAAATLNSSPALCGLAAHLRRPPKNHRSMPAIGMPSRRGDERVAELVQDSEAK